MNISGKKILARSRIFLDFSLFAGLSLCKSKLNNQSERAIETAIKK